MSVSLVHDAALAEPDPEPRADECWHAPVFWLSDGVRHARSTIGVRYDCAKCKVSGPAVFGEMRGINSVLIDAYLQFPHETLCPAYDAADLDDEG